MNSHFTAGIAISTNYGDDKVARVRFGLAQDFVTTAQEAGHQVYFADNSPTDEVIETLRGLGAKGERISNPNMPCLGRAEAIQQALKAGHDFTLLSEAEKVDLIQYLDAMLKYGGEHHVDILFPERSAEGMASHPMNMQRTEPIGNQRIAEITGYNFDWFMGAQLLSRRAATEYVTFQSDPGAVWPGGQMAAAARCLRRGMKGDSFRVEKYRYLESQRKIEENNEDMDRKRDFLLEKIVAEVAKAWKQESEVQEILRPEPNRFADYQARRFMR